jgi:hypothetical protein
LEGRKNVSVDEDLCVFYFAEHCQQKLLGFVENGVHDGHRNNIHGDHNVTTRPGKYRTIA